MTVNQGGRPSKAPERIAEILSATVGVVAREGLAGVTFAKVAEAAGLQRTLVHHYFGSRDQLIGAFIDHAVGAIGTEILSRDAGESLHERVTSLFATGAYRSPDDLAVWLELVALSTRDPEVRQRLHALWADRWLPALEAQLAEQYPGAPSDAVTTAAYALACLFEGHWSFSAQDLADERRQRQAERAALLVLDRLDAAQAAAAEAPEAAEAESAETN
ncbi:TetR family transcriptional regulator [Streptomyces sp. ISL-22]|uniref:TetR/AcrR family transcriptional regulator n=1 Tax=unclassified Streptomyces TaxID=2593676 RepID=UPI001BE900D9|nr:MULTISPECIES: TetR family transcriptional regulator [unclassified Streptomyces]MBT2423772.1 TetR family transcriptional regulator [Streptomyces sp. ISL-24]MBT2433492.1 TetR family transcriptional regulator [Streptomyces sp. ISL-22]